VKYRKVYALSERYALLEESFPKYLVYDPVFDEQVCEVPIKDITHHFKPVDYLQNLREGENLGKLEAQALQFVETLKDAADVSWRNLGVSGSIMVGLHKSSSDIDPIVYGSENCRKLYSALKSLLQDKESLMKPYTAKELKALFDFRSKDTVTSLEDFLKTESRKVLQGRFMNRDYFIRFVKGWDEVEKRYGVIRYTNEGYARIKATVTEDSEAIFTPCCYGIDNVKVLEGIRDKKIVEIASFRGRFCEQAEKGEGVIAQGKVEGVHRAGETEHFRLLLGNKPSDFMVLT
jgi:predicted nucleotidyltransferase